MLDLPEVWRVADLRLPGAENSRFWRWLIREKKKFSGRLCWILPAVLLVLNDGRPVLIWFFELWKNYLEALVFLDLGFAVPSNAVLEWFSASFHVKSGSLILLHRLVRSRDCGGGRSKQFLMGCASSKGISGDDGPKFRRPKASRRRMFSSSRREEVGEVNADARVGRDRSSTAWLISNSQRSGATSPPPLVGDSKNEGAGHQSRITVGARPNVLQPGSVVVNMEALEEQNLVISRISDGFNFEHVAAGWPSWLTAVAGDAVKGWLPRRADSFDNFNKVSNRINSIIFSFIPGLHVEQTIRLALVLYIVNILLCSVCIFVLLLFYTFKI